jgi:hypothetical protein
MNNFLIGCNKQKLTFPFLENNYLCAGLKPAKPKVD